MIYVLFVIIIILKFVFKFLLNILSIDDEDINDYVYTDVMDSILDYAYENKIIENNFISTRDLFESKIMNVFRIFFYFSLMI